MKDWKHCIVCRVNWSEELMKASRGEPTKLPVELVVHEAMMDYPVIQRHIGELFSITE